MDNRTTFGSYYTNNRNDFRFIFIYNSVCFILLLGNNSVLIILPNRPFDINHCLESPFCFLQEWGIFYFVKIQNNKSLKQSYIPTLNF